jgi:hypothetical protein
MQILWSQFDSQKPTCPTCGRRLHRHGRYGRRAQGAGASIPRWFCPGCRRTLSILPRGLLPYRKLRCADLQDAFDHWAFDDQPPPTKPARAALRDWLNPAWQRDLHHLCGQLVEAPLKSGQALWRGLRRCFASAEGLAEWLTAHYRCSLLGRYACQGPDRQSSQRPKAIGRPWLPHAIPHTFSFLNPAAALARIR